MQSLLQSSSGEIIATIITLLILWGFLPLVRIFHGEIATDLSSLFRAVRNWGTILTLGTLAIFLINRSFVNNDSRTTIDRSLLNQRIDDYNKQIHSSPDAGVSQ